MNLNWTDIRSINNSQYDGFEALVCQLAEYESVPQKSMFFRKGKPDGGIECYWKFPDSTEWGWQAKFFTRSLDAGQWGEVDKSVKRFLETHPDIVRLTVAIPVDLSDARKPKQKSAQDRWNDHVLKWQNWANRKGRSIHFEYWGEHQLLDRLSQDRHRGRVFFWFQQEFFDDNWFTERINESIADAGARYTKELDVNLPISELFDGLGRTNGFYKRLKGFVIRLQKNTPSSHQSATLSSVIQMELQNLHKDVTKICQTLSDIDEHSVEPINWEIVVNIIGRAKEQRSLCQKTIAEETELVSARSPENSSSNSDTSEKLRYVNSDLYRLQSDLSDLQYFVESEEAKLANIGAMLLVGKAGKGKTHLFCDVAQHRKNEYLPTILLLGGHFKGDVWQQMLELLDLEGQSREIFLGAVQAAAQARRRKALILIDALNESTDLTMWSKRLNSFLQVIRRYKWISVAVSVRTSYEDMVIPDAIQDDELLRVEHQGFSGVEYEATRHFFDFYGIEQPSVPLLNPEFETPLFLKILCEGLNNQKLNRIPKGLHGITAIFTFFIDSIFKKLQAPDKMDLSPNKNIVQNAVERLSSVMSDQTIHWIPIGEAEEIINFEIPERTYTDSLFYHLLSEGLITKDRFRTADNQLVEGISFAYQRLADHLITKNLLDKHLDNKSPVVALSSDTPIRKIVQEREQWWRPQTRGLIEAMSIQIPERTSRELIALVDQSSLDWFLASAFIESVLWRSSRAFNEETLKYVNKCIGYQDLHEKFIDILLTLAVDPEHPYNAEFLHRRLISDQMAERDAWWSMFLSEQYGQQTSVDRMIDWAWERSDKSHIEDESIRLCVVALTWFLTTSDRFVRDRATKAIVNLLSDRLYLLRGILQQFHFVDDLYLVERLLAVAYGCCLRNEDSEQIGFIAQYIYDWLFKGGKPPAHILLRDYGRGIIEYALVLGQELHGDVDKIRPPYYSDFPIIPSEEEIEAMKATDGSWDTGGTGWSRNWIFHSVMGWDFARYIIGTNIGHSEWLSLRLNEPIWKSADDIQNEFIDSLSEEQRNYWNIYDNARRELYMKDWRVRVEISDEILDVLENILEELPKSEKEEILSNAAKTKDKETAKLYREEMLAEENFVASLDKGKLGTFENSIKPHIENPRSWGTEPWFDLSVVQRWIVKRVFDLGWTEEKFGWFDKYHGQSQRDAHKTERVGKKYQWIAYHEILAYLADNFQFREGYSHHKDKHKYNGPWQLGRRDIDPSCVLKSKGDEEEVLTSSWWAPFIYKDWDTLENNTDWIRNIDDFPEIQSLLEVIDPNAGTQWLNLRSAYAWQQPTPYDKDPYQLDRKDFWFFIKGYLVYKSDLLEIVTWASQQDFMGNWMPEGRDFHDVYLGEFYWSPAYQYIEDPFIGEFGWRIPRRSPTDIAKPFLPMWERYIISEGSYDCSVDSGSSIYIPTKQLLNDLELQWYGIDGSYFNKQKELIAFDPSTQSIGPNGLLIRKDYLTEYLEKNNYAVLWTVLGEKRILTGGFNFDDWKGNTTINGVFQYTHGKITGSISGKFSPPTKGKDLNS